MLVHREAVDTQTEKVRAQYLADKCAVNVILNDELGPLFFAVVPVEDPEFWLDAFEREQDARDYIKRHSLVWDGQIDRAL